MATLTNIRNQIPSTETVAGRVVAFHGGKHVDLGEYVGDDAVALSHAGEKILAEVSAPKEPMAAPADVVAAVTPVDTTIRSGTLHKRRPE